MSHIAHIDSVHTGKRCVTNPLQLRITSVVVVVLLLSKKKSYPTSTSRVSPSGVPLRPVTMAVLVQLRQYFIHNTCRGSQHSEMLNYLILRSVPRGSASANGVLFFVWTNGEIRLPTFYPQHCCNSRWYVPPCAPFQLLNSTHLFVGNVTNKYQAQHYLRIQFRQEWRIARGKKKNVNRYDTGANGILLIVNCEGVSYVLLTAPGVWQCTGLVCITITFRRLSCFDSLHLASSTYTW